MKENIAVGKVLYTREEIENRARELGKQISEDYAGEELILLGTLKGAVMWMADLMKEITVDTKIDFISASSYGSGTTSSGVVKVTKDVDMDLYRKNILIVEDIVDTGTTLKFLKEYLEEHYGVAVDESRTGELVFEVPSGYPDFGVGYVELYTDGTETITGDTFLVYFSAQAEAQA